MKNLYDINDWTDIQEHQKIGEILMQCGKLSLENLGIALDIQKFENIPLGEILKRMKVITEEELSKALDLQVKIDEIIEKIEKGEE